MSLAFQKVKAVDLVQFTWLLICVFGTLGFVACSNDEKGTHDVYKKGNRLQEDQMEKTNYTSCLVSIGCYKLWISQPYCGTGWYESGQVILLKLNGVDCKRRKLHKFQTVWYLVTKNKRTSLDICRDKLVCALTEHYIKHEDHSDINIVVVVTRNNIAKHLYIRIKYLEKVQQNSKKVINILKHYMESKHQRELAKNRNLKSEENRNNEVGQSEHSPTALKTAIVSLIKNPPKKLNKNKPQQADKIIHDKKALKTAIVSLIKNQKEKLNKNKPQPADKIIHDKIALKTAIVSLIKDKKDKLNNKPQPADKIIHDKIALKTALVSMIKDKKEQLNKNKPILKKAIIHKKNYKNADINKETVSEKGIDYKNKDILEDLTVTADKNIEIENPNLTQESKQNNTGDILYPTTELGETRQTIGVPDTINDDDKIAVPSPIQKHELKMHQKKKGSSQINSKSENLISDNEIENNDSKINPKNSNIITEQILTPDSRKQHHQSDKKHNILVLMDELKELKESIRRDPGPERSPQKIKPHKRKFSKTKGSPNLEVDADQGNKQTKQTKHDILLLMDELQASLRKATLEKDQEPERSSHTTEGSPNLDVDAHQEHRNTKKVNSRKSQEQKDLPHKTNVKTLLDKNVLSDFKDAKKAKASFKKDWEKTKKHKKMIKKPRNVIKNINKVISDLDRPKLYKETPATEPNTKLEILPPPPKVFIKNSTSLFHANQNSSTYSVGGSQHGKQDLPNEEIETSSKKPVVSKSYNFTEFAPKVLTKLESKHKNDFLQTVNSSLKACSTESASGCKNVSKTDNSGSKGVANLEKWNKLKSHKLKNGKSDKSSFLKHKKVKHSQQKSFDKTHKSKKLNNKPKHKQREEPESQKLNKLTTNKKSNTPKVYREKMESSNHKKNIKYLSEQQNKLTEASENVKTIMDEFFMLDSMRRRAYNDEMSMHHKQSDSRNKKRKKLKKAEIHPKIQLNSSKKLELVTNQKSQKQNRNFIKKLKNAEAKGVHQFTSKKKTESIKNQKNENHKQYKDTNFNNVLKMTENDQVLDAPSNKQKNSQSFNEQLKPLKPSTSNLPAEFNKLSDGDKYIPKANEEVYIGEIISHPQNKNSKYKHKLSTTPNKVHSNDMPFINQPYDINTKSSNRHQYKIAATAKPSRDSSENPKTILKSHKHHKTNFDNMLDNLKILVLKKKKEENLKRKLRLRLMTKYVNFAHKLETKINQQNEVIEKQSKDTLLPKYNSALNKYSNYGMPSSHVYVPLIQSQNFESSNFNNGQFSTAFYHPTAIRLPVKSHHFEHTNPEILKHQEDKYFYKQINTDTASLMQHLGNKPNTELDNKSKTILALIEGNIYRILAKKTHFSTKNAKVLQQEVHNATYSAVLKSLNETFNSWLPTGDSLGNLSNWQSWGGCSTNCGSGGFQLRKRVCSTRKCIGTLWDVKECGLQNQCKASWVNWSGWSQCSTCHHGYTTRTRVCISHSNSTRCPGTSIKVKPCDQKHCKKVDKWLKWSAWSSCSTTCNSGVQRRSRECKIKSEPTPCQGLPHEHRVCVHSSCNGGNGVILDNIVKHKSVALICDKAWSTHSGLITWRTPNRHLVTSRTKSKRYKVEGPYLVITDLQDFDRGLYRCTSFSTTLISANKDCRPNHCLNGGQCIEQSHVGINSPYQRYFCICKQGYKGQYCGEEVGMSEAHIVGVIVVIMLLGAAKILLIYLCWRYKKSIDLKKKKEGFLKLKQEGKSSMLNLLSKSETKIKSAFSFFSAKKDDEKKLIEMDEVKVTAFTSGENADNPNVNSKLDQVDQPGPSTVGDSLQKTNDKPESLLKAIQDENIESISKQLSLENLQKNPDLVSKILTICDEENITCDSEDGQPNTALQSDIGTSGKAEQQSDQNFSLSSSNNKKIFNKFDTVSDQPVDNLKQTVIKTNTDQVVNKSVHFKVSRNDKMTSSMNHQLSTSTSQQPKSNVLDEDDKSNKLSKISRSKERLASRRSRSNENIPLPGQPTLGKSLSQSVDPISGNKETLKSAGCKLSDTQSTLKETETKFSRSKSLNKDTEMTKKSPLVVKTTIASTNQPIDKLANPETCSKFKSPPYDEMQTHNMDVKSIKTKDADRSKNTDFNHLLLSENFEQLGNRIYCHKHQTCVFILDISHDDVTNLNLTCHHNMVPVNLDMPRISECCSTDHQRILDIIDGYVAGYSHGMDRVEGDSVRIKDIKPVEIKTVNDMDLASEKLDKDVSVLGKSTKNTNAERKLFFETDKTQPAMGQSQIDKEIHEDFSELKNADPQVLSQHQTVSTPKKSTETALRISNVTNQSYECDVSLEAMPDLDQINYFNPQLKLQASESPKFVSTSQNNASYQISNRMTSNNEDNKSMSLDLSDLNYTFSPENSTHGSPPECNKTDKSGKAFSVLSEAKKFADGMEHVSAEIEDPRETGGFNMEMFHRVMFPIPEESFENEDSKSVDFHTPNTSVTEFESIIETEQGPSTRTSTSDFKTPFPSEHWLHQNLGESSSSTSDFRTPFPSEYWLGKEANNNSLISTGGDEVNNNSLISTGGNENVEEKKEDEEPVWSSFYQQDSPTSNE